MKDDFEFDDFRDSKFWRTLKLNILKSIKDREKMKPPSESSFFLLYWSIIIYINLNIFTYVINFFLYHTFSYKFGKSMGFANIYEVILTSMDRPNYGDYEKCFPSCSIFLFFL